MLVIVSTIIPINKQLKSLRVKTQHPSMSKCDFSIDMISSIWYHVRGDILKRVPLYCVTLISEVERVQFNLSYLVHSHDLRLWL